MKAECTSIYKAGLLPCLYILNLRTVVNNLTGDTMVVIREVNSNMGVANSKAIRTRTRLRTWWSSSCQGYYGSWKDAAS